MTPRLACIAVAIVAACGGTLDAGRDIPHGPLPVDERNPIILSNDGPEDNWQGEYAMLLANTGGPPLAGIVVNSSPAWMDLNANLEGWKQMVTAARNSGLRNIPDPIASRAPVLVRPGDGNIDATTPNQSEGANVIVETSRRLALPHRPVVIVTGGRLTDVADAYLMDPGLAGRIVVVSSLGTANTSGGSMGVPNGEMDIWADIIVAQRLRYIQVSAYYDQRTDVPESLISQVPDNPFGNWIVKKQPLIKDLLVASDQIGVVAVALPGFVTEVIRVSSRSTDSTKLPELALDPAGPVWLVRTSKADLATARFRKLLLDSQTYHP